MLKILSPDTDEKAYAVSVDEFQSLYKKITGTKLDITMKDDGKSDLVVIGSDSVNSFASEMIFKDVIPGFKIKYGTDDYHILSAKYGKRKILFLAGGRGRSTIYAVYDFFYRQANCRYFWDGDIIPSKKSISIDKLDIAESPRFQYRGTRYFAHRSLHRFQAEHWNFEDWKKEIDWLLKKRLNLFMLRIAMDDLFQKAFPDIVKYPSKDKPLPEAVPRSYDDRTLFWDLKFRGELRKKILAYAFERDLMHPEDFGTMTHWYSRTPKDFLEKEKPDFVPQCTECYSQETGLVWDIRKKRNLDNYFKLTEAHIKEYGRPEIFHTIGLAERKCFEDRSKNLELKLFTYRALLRKLRERYPNAPVLLASWDMMMYWEDEEVKKLVAELDPQNTIFFEYTSENLAETNVFTKWGIVKKFPWIFGIFHAYEQNSEMRGNYSHIMKRLKLAADDKFCKGMVLWPEVSHSDTFMLEFFTSNAWSPLERDMTAQVEKFCNDRYGSENKAMRDVWKKFMPVLQLRSWAWTRHDRVIDTFSELFFRILENTNFPEEKLERAKYSVKSYMTEIAKADKIFEALAALKFTEKDTFIYRDVIDIARSAATRVILYNMSLLEVQLDLWRKSKEKAENIVKILDDCKNMIRCLGEILGLDKDYSLYASYLKLGETQKINPIFENTLKGNAECDYCRSFIYELFEPIYLRELKTYGDWIKERLKSNDRKSIPQRGTFKADAEKIRDDFYATSLKKMAPPETKDKVPKLRKKLLEIAAFSRG